MARLVGSVDGRGRPLTRIETGGDSLLAVIDTGFNGDLMVTELSATLLKLTFGPEAALIELGNGTLAKVYQSEIKLNWLGENRYVQVLISQDWVTRADDPTALIGTGLLRPHLLLIDFEESTVEIETQ